MKLILVGLMALTLSVAQAQNKPKAEAIYGTGPNEFSLATGSPGARHVRNICAISVLN